MTTPHRDLAVLVSEEVAMFMRWSALMILVLLFTTPGLLASLPPDPPAPPITDVVVVQHVGGEMWVVLDNLPVPPELPLHLYTYLRQHVQTQSNSPLYPTTGGVPIIVQFVPPAQANRPFPLGTEDFGGLVGIAHWQCLAATSLPDLEYGYLTSTATDQTAIIATVCDQPDVQMTIGYLAHELTHILGAVDGERCPAHPNYQPNATRGEAPQDAYWWYGVTGVFELKPSGLVWDALSGQCDKSDHQPICHELAVILADYVR